MPYSSATRLLRHQVEHHQEMSLKRERVEQHLSQKPELSLMWYVVNKSALMLTTALLLNLYAGT